MTSFGPFIFEKWCKCTFKKVNNQKNFSLNYFFVGVLKVNDENSRIPGSGSTPKCHGSETLVLYAVLPSHFSLPRCSVDNPLSKLGSWDVGFLCNSCVDIQYLFTRYLGSSNHSSPTPTPTSSTRGEAGRNHLNQEITPTPPHWDHGIDEQYSQTISNLGHTAVRRRCDLLSP